MPLVQRRDYIRVPPVFSLISGLYRAQPYLLHISGFECKLSLYTDAPCTAVGRLIQMLHQGGLIRCFALGFRQHFLSMSLNLRVTACELCL